MSQYAHTGSKDVGIAEYDSWSYAAAEQCCLIRDAGLSEFYIVNYSHYFAVIGLSSYARFWHRLGKYCPSLSEEGFESPGCEGGWIFPKYNRKLVDKYIKILLKM